MVEKSAVVVHAANTPALINCGYLSHYALGSNVTELHWATQAESCASCFSKDSFAIPLEQALHVDKCEYQCPFSLCVRRRVDEPVAPLRMVSDCHEMRYLISSNEDQFEDCVLNR